ncbi:MAG: transcription-repair coupling factor, partial [Verrucomicrobia bacterium]|nr:transcription-repair coupling factor [Verrucomicrobiota bacterium]
MQSLARRLEQGGALSCAGICPSAQPFFAALVQQLFPRRPVVFQQDLETWLGASPQFYPAWEILPHEGKLPHADVISERLQTLVALAQPAGISNPKSQIVLASIAALLQKTFPPEEIQSRTRTFERGGKIAPLDLIEWLEEQGYESEAQVSQKGEIALRGGIVDVFPPTSPWPVRLEFFGDELESLREFDPLTQVSRGEITSVTLPPAGELGILKRWQVTGDKWQEANPNAHDENLVTRHLSLATLLDYLPRETIFLLCEPEALAVHAESYAQQIPADDPFFIAWPDFLVELHRRGFTSVELDEADGAPNSCSAISVRPENQRADQEIGAPIFNSLDAFRPLAERAPEPQIAEAQRREFFAQLHRWLRQDYAVHVFCN